MLLKSKFTVLIFLLAGLDCPALNADPLFSSAGSISLTLVSDFTSLLKEKDKNAQYPGTLIYEKAGQTHEIKVELQVRGNFRLENCRVPGLRIRFPETVDQNSPFLHQDKLKLVTQCKSNASVYQTYLLQEFLIYKTYARLTPYSFRTRLVEIDYQDSGKKSRNWTNLAFFIEDKNQMAARLAATVVDQNIINHWELAVAETNLFSIFQYMIGNADYSVLKGEGDESCCHNAKLLDTNQGYVPVPYDFDLAGVINATYAAPPANLNITKVTTRLYRGFCRANGQLDATLAVFNQKRDELYASLGDSTLLDKRTVKKVYKYLDGFYKTLSNPKKVNKRFYKKCRLKSQEHPD